MPKEIANMSSDDTGTVGVGPKASKPQLPIPKPNQPLQNRGPKSFSLCNPSCDTIQRGWEKASTGAFRGDLFILICCLFWIAVLEGFLQTIHRVIMSVVENLRKEIEDEKNAKLNSYGIDPQTEEFEYSEDDKRILKAIDAIIKILKDIDDQLDTTITQVYVILAFCAICLAFYFIFNCALIWIKMKLVAFIGCIIWIGVRAPLLFSLPYFYIYQVILSSEIISIGEYKNEFRSRAEVEKFFEVVVKVGTVLETMAVINALLWGIIWVIDIWAVWMILAYAFFQCKRQKPVVNPTSLNLNDGNENDPQVQPPQKGYLASIIETRVPKVMGTLMGDIFILLSCIFWTALLGFLLLVMEHDLIEDNDRMEMEERSQHKSTHSEHIRNTIDSVTGFTNGGLYVGLILIAYSIIALILDCVWKCTIAGSGRKNNVLKYILWTIFRIPLIILVPVFLIYITLLGAAWEKAGDELKGRAKGGNHHIVDNFTSELLAAFGSLLLYIFISNDILWIIKWLYDVWSIVIVTTYIICGRKSAKTIYPNPEEIDETPVQKTKSSTSQNPALMSSTAPVSAQKSPKPDAGPEAGAKKI